jgi:hypothetical protein
VLRIAASRVRTLYVYSLSHFPIFILKPIPTSSLVHNEEKLNQLITLLCSPTAQVPSTPPQSVNAISGSHNLLLHPRPLRPLSHHTETTATPPTSPSPQVTQSTPSDHQATQPQLPTIPKTPASLIQQLFPTLLPSLLRPSQSAPGFRSTRVRRAVCLCIWAPLGAKKTSLRILRWFLVMGLVGGSLLAPFRWIMTGRR